MHPDDVRGGHLASSPQAYAPFFFASPGDPESIRPKGFSPASDDFIGSWIPTRRKVNMAMQRVINAYPRT